MVSFQAPLELDNLSQKRKSEEPQTEIPLQKRLKPENTKSIYEIELQLETPLPSEWQQCLDIQSGQIHFYNTRTHTRTCKDPRESRDSLSQNNMSLDLQLNLACESQRKENAKDAKKQESANSQMSLGDFLRVSGSSRDNNTSGGISRNPQRLEGQQEMVATVCTKCHLLVLLCKTSPTCPNCKLMNTMQ